MLTLSTCSSTMVDMATTRRSAPAGRTVSPRRPRGPHCVREAARTIRTDGVEAVTLRDVGRRLGVSRTALYRHFADKSALLAAVAREGFQAFSRELREAWDAGGGGIAGFRAMGTAYMRFAQSEAGALPDHVRPVQGALRERCGARRRRVRVVPGAARCTGGTRARRRDPAPAIAHALGRYIWATMHGVAMLSIDGQLGSDPAAADALSALMVDRVSAAIADATVASAFRRTSG